MAQQRVLEEIVHRIKAEAVHAAVEPEPQHAFHIGHDIGVAEVQLGLLDEERVHVILLAPGIPMPGWPAEHRQPVVGRGAIGARVHPEEPVGFGIGEALTAFLKERVLVRAMVQNLVDDDFQPQGMGAGDQRVEIGKGAERRIDPHVVGHVIAHVLHRRGEDRRQPDAIAPQRRDVIEAAGDARQIADAVAVGVLK